MKTKAEVSDNYLVTVRGEHAAKQYPNFNKVLMTGGGRANSIGSAIARALMDTNPYFEIDCYNKDIRDTVNVVDMNLYTGLILCHGIMHLDWFENTPDDYFQDIMDVNVVGSMKMIRAFVNATIDTACRKRIIIIGSMAYNRVLNGSSAYCASKAALAHLARCLAWELAPKAFDVFTLHPSNTLDAPMSEDTIQGLMRYRKLNRKDAEGYWKAGLIRDSHLTKREIAAQVVHLFDHNSGYLSGCQIELGGGAR